MVRTLIALLITLTILPLAISVFSYAGNFSFNYNEANNEMALMDLRRVMLLAYDIDVSDYEISFIYHNDNYTLRYLNNKLLLQPGSQMYLNGILDAYFTKENGSIYVNYIDENGKEYKRNIGKEKGIYIDEFLNNDDGSSNDNLDDS